VTGLVKLLSFFVHTRVLQLSDPIMQIPFRELFLVAGLIELAIAAYCLISNKINNSLVIIAWLSTIFLTYRLALFWVGWQLPCPCLGYVIQMLHISPVLADMIMKIVMGYMIVGSYIHLFLERLAAKTDSVQNTSLKTEDILHSSPGGASSKPFKRGCHSFLICSFSFACLFYCQKLLAADIQLDGNVYEVAFDADSKQTQSATNHFSLSLHHDKWECKTEWNGYAELLAFDGTNTYTQHFFPPPAAGAKVNTKEITTAEIRRGSSCIDGLPTTRILWIGYCARQFFEVGNDTPIISPWGHPALLGADSMTYKAEWLDSNYMIPGTLKFLMSYNFWKKELKAKYRDADEPNPFKDNELMGEYHVLSSTNSEDVTLPTEFELVRYAISQSGGAVVRERFHGQVFNIGKIESTWKMPPLHLQAQVQDFRFSNEGRKWLHVSYKTPQGDWPGTNDLLVVANLSAAIKGYAESEKKLYQSQKERIDPNKRRMAWLIMASIFFIPPLVYFLVLAKKLVKKQNNK